MKRARRFLLIALAVIVALAGVIVVAGHYVLHSGYATAQVASRLEALYGGPVRVQTVDVGVNGSSLKGLQLFEAHAGQDDKPWVQVADVKADVSLWDLLRGAAMPRDLTLTEPVLTLRFDKDGRLLTQLPQAESQPEHLPNIRVTNGKLTVRQEGHPDMVVQGIDGTLRPEGSQLVLEGKVADPYWRDWSLDGTVDQPTKASTLHLKTAEPIHISQDMLHHLAFVDPGIWREVQVEGDSPVDLTARLTPGDHGFHYHVALEPVMTKVRVTAIDLTATDARGKLIVDDEIVRLTDVHGRAADGDAHVEAELDFHATPSRLKFDVNVDGLVLHELPRKWSLPSKIDGRLKGWAKIVLLLSEGQAQVSGDGQGEVLDARVAGLPAKPILLKLHSDGSRLHFASDSQAALGIGLSLAAYAVGLQAPPQQATGGGSFFLPELVRLVNEGTLAGVRAVTDTGTRLVDRLTQITGRQKEPGKPPNYLEATLGLQDVDLAQLVQGLGVKVPFRVTGRITIDVHVAIPIDTPNDFKAYRLNGNATLPRLGLEGLEFEQVKARVVYTDGVLRLEELTGRIPDGPAGAGTLRGTASMQVFPPGDLRADVALKQVPMARLLTLVPGAVKGAGGAVSGAVTVRAPSARLKDVDAWEASGMLNADRVQAYGWTLEGATAPLRLSQGAVTIANAQGKLEGIAVSGSADVRLSDPYPYHVNVSFDQGNLAALQRLAPEVRPPVAVEGSFTVTAQSQGTLRPLTWSAAGTGSANDLKVEHLDVNSVQFRWKADDEKLTVTDLRAGLYGGELTGSAQVPLDPKAAGSVEIRFEGVDVGGLTRDVAVPIKLDGKASGTFQGVLSSAAADRDRNFTSRLDLEAPRLRVQGIPAERLHGDVTYKKGVVGYHLEGETLGGRFHLDGQLPSGPRPPAAPAQQGRLTVEGAQLGRLGPALGVRRETVPLHGTLDLELTFEHVGEHFAPVGEGTFQIRNLRWGDTDLSGRVAGGVRLTERELRLQDITGTLGQGLLRARLGLGLQRGARSWFTVALDQVEVSRLLAPWPALASRVEGPADIRLRGTLGREWVGSGDFLMVRGRLLDEEVTDWRLPFDFAVAPASARGQIEVRDMTAQVALGRVSGRGSIGFGTGSRLDAHLRFIGLALGALAGPSSGLSSSASGQLTGRADFSGTDVRSVDDVSGVIEGKFGQTQAMTIPVLQQVTGYVSPGIPSSSFRTGELRARLARGTFRVERLSLEGTTVQLFVQGNVTLRGGLGLDVWANTGRVGPNPVFLERLALRVPLTGPLPLPLLTQASNFLSNRTVHLRVTGTIRSPVIQVEPVSLLTEEAVRYFLLQRYVPLSGSQQPLESYLP